MISSALQTSWDAMKDDELRVEITNRARTLGLVPSKSDSPSINEEMVKLKSMLNVRLASVATDSKTP